MKMPYGGSLRDGPVTTERLRGFTTVLANGAISVIVILDQRGGLVRYRVESVCAPADVAEIISPAAANEPAAPNTDTSERRRAHALFEHSPFSIQIFSPDGWTIAVNRAWQRLWGATPEVARKYNILNDSQLAEKGILPYVLRAFAGESLTIPTIDYDPERTTGVAGARRWVRAYIYPVMDRGKVAEVILKHEDVTAQTRTETALLEAHDQLEQRVIERTAELAREIAERTRAEQLLFIEKERLEVSLRSIGDGVITTDPAGSVQSLNPVAEKLLGWPEQEARGRLLADIFQVLDDETRRPIADPVATCLQRDGAVHADHGRILLVNRRGEEYAIEGNASPIHGRNDETLGVVIVFRDVTQQRRASKEMAYHAQHDALTGLVNRREFERRLDQALASSKEYGWQHAFCFLDLDRFKIVNDTAGHMAGDELLRQITALLLDGVRERDTLARLGGDEFGLLLHNCALEKAWQIGESLMERLRGFHFLWKGRTFQVGASIGIVPITAQASDATRLLSRADKACYIAKDMGRDRVFVCPIDEQAPLQRPVSRVHLDELRSAVGDGRLRLYCQPIVPLHAAGGNLPAMYEMLLRMIDGAGNVILPSAFIPAAERHGVMRKFDRWVISTTLRALRETTALTPDVCIGINLSPHSLNDDKFANFLLEELEACSLRPQQVCFEIAEGVAVQHFARVARFVSAARELGCRITLDDFGGGLSSFLHLKKLAVDYVKISGQLIGGMVKDEIDGAVVAAACQIAAAAGCGTIAKHVDSPQHMERARALGIGYAQGFAIAAPRPLVEFV